MASNPKHSFTVVDYVIFALALLASLGIGLWAAFAGKCRRKSKDDDPKSHGRKKSQSPEEFLLGGRSMPLIPTTLSLFSSVVSGIALLSYPAEIYTRGSTLIWTVVGMAGALIVSCVFVIPVIYQVRSVSIYQYLEDRFQSKILRICGSVIFTLSILMYMSVVLYSPAIALAGVTEMPVWALIVIVGLICTTYTTIGGLKGVIWTDAFQSVVMYAGSITLVVKGTLAVGSMGKVFEIASNRSRIDGLTNIDPNPFQYMTVWTASIGGFFYWLASFGSSQLAVQRYLSMPSIAKARLLVLLTIPCMVFVNFLVFYTGFTMFAYYADCDPIKAGYIKSRDQLVIYFMIEILRDFRGLPGLFLACLLSGTLSTVSSGVNSLSAVSFEDFMKPIYIRIYGESPNDQTATRLTRIVGVFYGFCAIGLAFSAQPLGGIFSAVTSGLGALAGPLLGLMFLGYLVPWANWIGGLVGTALGAFLALWVFIGSAILKPPKPNLSTSILGCPSANSSFASATSMAPTTPLYANSSTALLSGIIVQAPASPPEGAIYRFYTLSYFMFPLLGAVTTFVVGCIVSALTGCGRNAPKYRPELLYWTNRKMKKEPQDGSNAEISSSRASSLRRPSIQNVDIPRIVHRGPKGISHKLSDANASDLDNSLGSGGNF